MLSTPRSSTVFRALWVVLLFAGSVRVVYWLVYARTMPFLTHPLADAGIYEGWATAIAQGDVWSRAAGVFYRAPLYPYFLAAIHVGFGETMPWAGLLQSALGIVLLWMVSRLAWRIAGPRAAIASAALLALYGPLVAFESKRLPTTLGLVLHVASLVLLCRLAERPSVRRAVWAGLALGLSVLVRPTWMLLVPIFFVLVPAAGSARRGRSWFRLSIPRLWLLGIVVVLVGFTAVRNRVVGGEWALVSTNGGMTFYQGNHPGNHSGLLAIPPEVGAVADAASQSEAENAAAERLTGHDLTTTEASRFWLVRGWSFMVGHPVEWLRLEVRKSDALLRSFEYGDNYAYAAERSQVWPLWLLPLPFGVLLGLALGGWVLSRGRVVAGAVPRGRTAGAENVAPLVVTVSALLGLATCLVFYVSSRYRIDAAPALAIWGGVGLGRLSQTIGRPRRGASPPANGNPPIGRARWGLAFGLAALVMILSLRPVGAPARSQESMGTLQMAVAMLADGRIEQADRALARATDLYPENALAWKHRLEQTARQQGTEAARALFSGVPPATREDADLRFVRGILAEASGDLVEADSAYRAAISVRGRFPEAEARLAAIWARRGEIEPAESLLTIATRAGPAPPSVFLQLATLRRQLGDVDGASDAIANAGNDRATIPTGLQAWIHLRRGETASTESALSNGKPESGPAERDRIALRMQALLVEGRAEEAEALGRSAWPLRDDGDSSTMAIRYYGTLAAIERGASTSAWQTQWSLSAADFSLLQDLLESRVGPWGAAPAPATRRALHRLRLAAPAVAEALTRLLREETGVHIDAEGAEDR